MEREILFRGKRMDNGEWVYGYFVKRPDMFLPGIEKGFILRMDEDSLSMWDLVDTSTVGQYTGLTDKNGKKIFEGDIVRTVYDGIKNIFVVVWDNEELDFKATNGKKNYGAGGFQYMPCCEEVEIVGNIHDNPELLEVQG